jgi:predicted lipid-binding transport protein (Tim44 family)
MRLKMRLVISLVLMLLLANISGLVQDADARAGGGRSFGGSGSRSFSPPSRSYSGSPAPARPAQTPGQPAGGGFLRSMGGGLLGGALGAMLFSSMGFGSAGGGGGIGMLEIILFAGIAYFFYTMVMRRRSNPALAHDAPSRQSGPGAGQPSSSWSHDTQQGGAAPVSDGLDQIRKMDPAFDEARFRDTAMDIFFKVQGAWTNRDLSAGSGLLTDQMKGIFQQDIDNLLREKKSNRLENIAVRKVELVEAWQETGQDFVKAIFFANLLDYTTDDATGSVMAGSKTEPVKFEECWTFTRSAGNNPWRLSAISQV